jgi:hypothetical protein
LEKNEKKERNKGEPAAGIFFFIFWTQWTQKWAHKKRHVLIESDGKCAEKESREKETRKKLEILERRDKKRAEKKKREYFIWRIRVKNYKITIWVIYE